MATAVVEVSCEGDVTQTMVSDRMEELIEKLRQNPAEQAVVEQLVKAFDFAEQFQQTMYCPFFGEVEGRSTDRYGVWEWTCPLCGREHEEDEKTFV